MDSNRNALARLLSGDYSQSTSPLGGTPPSAAPVFPREAIARLLSEPSPKTPNLLGQAQQQYPVLNGLGLGYTSTPRSDSGYLEFWPPDEPGAYNRPRPQALPMGSPGVEVFRSDTRPIDILGDVASHHLVNTDPIVKNHYQDFKSSLNPEQHQTLRRQYDHAVQNGERRSFEQWSEIAGLPAYFRGYAFQQWPQEATDQMYTQGQRNGFDSLLNYLSGKTDGTR